MALERYLARRDFSRTPEPHGETARRSSAAHGSFVVQKHAARRLHYDFRLELDGVLKSWAVPKGPSLNPADRRLAVQVEDHPVEYGDFEGVIPRGQYGGGSVLLWDRGTWTPMGDPRRGLAQGKLEFTLEGEKLRGRWLLVRTGEGDKPQWLLRKLADEEARAVDAAPITETRPESVDSGLTLEQIGDRPRVVREMPEPTSKGSARAASGTTRRGRAGATRDAAEVAGVRISNPGRVLFPEHGLTKLELARYLERVADAMLPYLAARPLTLLRCPAGHDKQCFYQKHLAEAMPPELVAVDVLERSGEHATYVAVESVAGLVSLAQLGVLELHPWGARREDLDHPDVLVFDLDPGPGVPWADVVAAARELRALLAELELEGFAKLTGGKGVHLVVPIAPELSWEPAKAFCRAVVEILAGRAPRRYVTVMAKAKRRGRIFLDYLRNGFGNTAIAPYSPRARAGAPVATPVRWSELTSALLPDRYTVRNLQRRLSAQRSDPWEGYFTLRQRVPPAVLTRVNGEAAGR